MDQATLVSPDIAAGIQAIALLDAARVPPSVALLMTSEETEDWRLVLSGPALDQSDFVKAYEKVAEILAGRFVYLLPPNVVLPMTDPFIKELRRMFGKTKDTQGMRLGGQTIGNQHVLKAYVYRIK